jgi:hypothetical protein
VESAKKDMGNNLRRESKISPPKKFIENSCVITRNIQKQLEWES